MAGLVDVQIEHGTFDDIWARCRNRDRHVLTNFFSSTGSLFDRKLAKARFSGADDTFPPSIISEIFMVGGTPMRAPYLADPFVVTRSFEIFPFVFGRWTVERMTSYPLIMASGVLDETSKSSFSVFLARRTGLIFHHEQAKRTILSQAEAIP